MYTCLCAYVFLSFASLVVLSIFVLYNCGLCTWLINPLKLSMHVGVCEDVFVLVWYWSTAFGKVGMIVKAVMFLCTYVYIYIYVKYVRMLSLYIKIYVNQLFLFNSNICPLYTV